MLIPAPPGAMKRWAGIGDCHRSVAIDPSMRLKVPASKATGERPDAEIPNILEIVRSTSCASVVATIIGAYIVNHYIVPEGRLRRSPVAAVVSAPDPNCRRQRGRKERRRQAGRCRQPADSRRQSQDSDQRPSGRRPRRSTVVEKPQERADEKAEEKADVNLPMCRPRPRAFHPAIRPRRATR